MRASELKKPNIFKIIQGQINIPGRFNMFVVVRIEEWSDKNFPILGFKNFQNLFLLIRKI